MLTWVLAALAVATAALAVLTTFTGRFTVPALLCAALTLAGSFRLLPEVRATWRSAKLG